MSDYLKVVYDENSRPYTDYPEKLCRHLMDSFEMKPGTRFLEVGCGRGEFLQHFSELGLEAEGVDLSPEAPEYLPDIPVKVADVEQGGLPYSENTFDVIYSKSFLEHLREPERFLAEAYRILKPGGLLLTLVPDWESNYKIYFDDYTHRTPFTRISLDEIYRVYGFADVGVTRFRQLPIVWKYPWLNYFCMLIAPMVPVRTSNKFLRWSRELMLVGSGRKPGN